jgi:hypothetical protein
MEIRPMMSVVWKIVALLIAIGNVVAMIVAEHGITKGSLAGGALLLLPLALIWFPEQPGSFTGYVGRGGDIDTETSPGLVSALGWFFLLGYPVLIHYLLKG